MAHNNLRRAIEQERLSSYETPAEKIIAQGKLLDRALSALGGPVQDNRPQTLTPAQEQKVRLVEDLIEHALEADRQVWANCLNEAPHTPTEAEMADIGRPEDESEYQAGLGAPLPQEDFDPSQLD